MRAVNRVGAGGENRERAQASPSAVFARRAALYTRYDVQLREYTRFFAAAATINAVLARLFSVFPAIRSPRSLCFLNEVGAALETENLVYASEVSRRPPGSALDQALVYAEQAQLQRCVYAQQVQRPQHWKSTRNELNGLLNGRYAASLFCQWCERSGRLSRVLREARGHLGMELDFATESHRICIGLKLIEYIRRESTSPAAAARP
jgi:hypothetical protein